jgi:cytochrome c
MKPILLAVMTAQVFASVAFAQADEETLKAGKRQFRSCQACHGLEKGDSRQTGPTLNGLFGRKAGTVADFAFSDAMKASTIVWSDETLDQFLASPQQTIPGNKMALGAVKDPEQRAQLVAYLKSATAP